MEYKLCFRNAIIWFRSFLRRMGYLDACFLLLAAALRLWALDMKPPHFDEGINGWFADQVRELGYYRYDPTNYHGPLYFYVLFIVQTLFGRNLWVLRMPAVIGSIMSVWLALRFDRFFGKMAARLGALTLAVSPAAVFYGRYAIHESWVTASLMVLMLGVFGLWSSGDRRSLFITILGVTLLLLLKETAVIHIGCLLLAIPCLIGFFLLSPTAAAVSFAPQRWAWKDLFLTCSLSLGVLFLFYSGMLLNLKGFFNLFQTLPAWIHTGVEAGGHVKSEYQIGPLNYYWLALMIRYEWPSFVGLLFTVRLLGKASLMMRYLGIYAVGVLMAYSIVPYKTPWCIISILWPFALLFGVAVQEGWVFKKWRSLIGVGACFLLAGSLVICVRLNFWHSTDPEEPYVYVQTFPEIKLLTEPLLEKAKKDPRAYHLQGQILLESYYPIPWMLGDFTDIGYYSKDNFPQKFSGDFIVIEASKMELVEKKLQEPYYRQYFKLRDAMGECVVYFKKAAFPDLQESRNDKIQKGVDRFFPELIVPQK